MMTGARMGPFLYVSLLNVSIVFVLFMACLVRFGGCWLNFIDAVMFSV